MPHVRSLVPGAGGFVGAHLVRHLEEHGDEVVEMERTVDGDAGVEQRGQLLREEQDVPATTAACGR